MNLRRFVPNLFTYKFYVYMCQKFISMSKVLAKLLQKQNDAIFWDTVYRGGDPNENYAKVGHIGGRRRARRT